MRKKKEGLILKEKVAKMLEKAKKKGLMYLLFEEAFKEEEEHGQKF